MARARQAPILTLTTDFGLRDAFVGILKGVILSRCPEARLVDLTHGLAPGDVRAGAFVLLSACRFFPRGAIHLAVVDPGVGSGRAALAARTPEAIFLGPDNGLLSWALAGAREVEVRRLTCERLWLRPVSATFHGRDIFAPVAAHLAAGGRFEQVGEQVTDWVRLPWPEPRCEAGDWLGKVLYVDHYGNAITNLPNALTESASAHLALRVAGRRAVPLGSFYQAVPAGQAVVVPGSSGYLEIAINGGSAARALGLEVGSPIRLATAPPGKRRGSAARTGGTHSRTAAG